ncbi:DUF4233 domain-containing protein [Propioniciclava flava]|nr:DUF4233 domain-containing protein [Propioniciclava flava]
MLRQGNPMIKTVSLTLIFEVIVCILAMPGMIQVSDVAIPLALGAGGVAALLPLIAAATLRTPLGWVLAWVSQIACLALGLLTPWMYVVGGAFAALFVVEFVLGRRIESDTAAR